MKYIHYITFVTIINNGKHFIDFESNNRIPTKTEVNNKIKKCLTNDNITYGLLNLTTLQNK